MSDDTNMAESITDQFDNCGELKAMISTGIDADSFNCTFFSLIAFADCGCTDGPPADSCYICPNGNLIPNGNLVPDISGLIQEDPVGPDLSSIEGQTCNELALTFSVTKAIFVEAFGQLGDALGDAGQDGNTQADVNVDDLPLCSVMAGPCGCEGGGCNICEFGLKNPDFIAVEDFTCSQGVTQFESAYGSTGSINENICKEGRKAVLEAGCECNESSAFVPTIISILVFVSTTTTILAFLV